MEGRLLMVVKTWISREAEEEKPVKRERLKLAKRL